MVDLFCFLELFDVKEGNRVSRRSYPYPTPFSPILICLFVCGLYLGLESPPVSASTNPARSLAASQTEAKGSHW
jgi:hypothetical protein